MEDNPIIGIFNYLKRGFWQQPTDLYLRPWNIAVEAFGIQLNVEPYCIGSRPEIYYQLKFLDELLRLQDGADLFGLVANGRMSHDYINSVGGIDYLFESFFHRAFEDDLLKNTFLLFFGDHGLRWGPIRESVVGKYEDRLPMSLLVAPKRFLREYPKMAENLRKNQNRLTTVFDVHATMLQLLHFNGKVATHSVRDRGISLFTEIPESRTCEDATVDPHWCVCHEDVVVSVSDHMMQKAAKALLQHINGLIADSQYSTQCAMLELRSVLSATRRTAAQRTLLFEGDETDAIDRDSASAIDYTVLIETSPGEGHFEGMIRFDGSEISPAEVVGSVTRTNSYGESSHCVDSQRLKLFCFCVTQGMPASSG